MIINHNISALNTHRQLGANNNAVQNSLEKLSSGLGINKAGDDAAGLAISEKMRGQIRGLEMAEKNAQDGISLIQTAEGALSETHDILQRMRELAVQASNDTNNEVDRKELQKEMNQLIEEIDCISNDTEFNTKTLLDGSFTNNKFHIGANEGQSISLSIESMGTGNIGQVITGKVYEGTTSGTLAKTDFTDKTSNSGSNDEETFKVTVNGSDTTVKLDQDYGDVDSVLTDINNQLSGTGVEAKLNDNNEVVFSSEEDFSLDVSSANSFSGANVAETDIITGAHISTLTVDTDTETTGGIMTQVDADEAITAINNAIENVSAERSKLGAFQNRLEHTINNL